jgi:hypothetical protein
MPVTRRNRKNSRKASRRNERKNGVSRRNNKKGGYRMYKFWPRNRVIAFVNALAAKGNIANPGSVTESRGLEILAEVANVSVTELQNNINPIYFGKVYLGLSENDLERGLLKGRSESGFMNQMDEMKKEQRWGNVATFNKLNFGNVPEMHVKNKLN